MDRFKTEFTNVAPKENNNLTGISTDNVNEITKENIE